MGSSIHQDLIAACSQDGCPLCRLAAEAVSSYFETLFYESVNDVPTREALRRTHGFCAAHTAEITDWAAGDALGVSIIYHDILGTILKALPDPGPEQPAQPRPTWPGFGRGDGQARQAVQALAPQESCPACRQRDTIDALFLKELSETLLQPDTAAALQASGGLCLPHLSALLQRARRAEETGLLLRIHRHKLEALRGELAEYIRKNDYRFRSEAIRAEEGEAWRKAARWTTGGKKR